jgi:hemoglobin
VKPLFTLLSLLAFITFSGCGSSGGNGNRHYFTSGSRQADQRADQRMARSEQLSGQGNNDKPADASLYQRLGSNDGLHKLVDDWVTRLLADPRVNFTRKGIYTGWIDRKPAYWNPTPENVATLKQHMAEFLALATGGPSVYHGKPIQQAHAGMKITNAEFDAAIGDLKATLDKFQVANQDQKDLLSIVESTRVQIVEKR